jgi:hypothetical protein
MERYDADGKLMVTAGPCNVAPIVTPITVTAAAQTLAALKGSALAATTRKVTIRPSQTGIVWHAGVAVAATHVPLLTDDLQLIGTPASLATITLIVAAATVGAWLIEEAQ